MRNNKGVTLVALVITIIVLIILAAVSLATLTGDNSILTRAQEAKDSTTESQAISLINTALNTIKTEATAKLVVDNTDISTYISGLASTTGNPDLSLPSTYKITVASEVVTISTEIKKGKDTYTVSGKIDFSASQGSATGKITGATSTKKSS